MDYTARTTSELQIARATLLAGLRNPRTANKPNVLRWVGQIEDELISRGTSKVDAVKQGWTTTRVQPGSPIDEIRIPATGEVIGSVMISRGWTKAFDAQDRKIGEVYGTGVDAANRAANMVWQTYESRQKAAA